ncbi:hypothetical protein K504DRAFT_502222 [Pleomassaria siparia CBS 279.74]|uniref:Uncharacterized protein n=1 Tax=Pleomassaria siparia CBS 279.74 TaxID=1314801 RepID=A0A6G1KAC9_9PLEO|nr:hypothetical protein K504DRAFT_502222 [Pleomassaria siparia CBS 279.74]
MDYDYSASIHPTSTCYFSHLPSSPDQTPSTSPLSTYSFESLSDPTHPLLAFRTLPLSSQTPTSTTTTTTTMDASKLLQLQTAASHSRPTALPLQTSSSSQSNSSSASSSASTSPSLEPMACCSRCRRSSTSHDRMVKFGTNLYYCRHCASMVGYSPG